MLKEKETKKFKLTIIWKKQEEKLKKYLKEKDYQILRIDVLNDYMKVYDLMNEYEVTITSLNGFILKLYYLGVFDAKDMEEMQY